MPNNTRIPKFARATTVTMRDGYMTVTYHDTDVVRWNDKEIILDAGGWLSATTKARMNQTANQFSLGYYVYQRAGKWFVDFGNETFPFDNTLILPRYPCVITASPSQIDLDKPALDSVENSFTPEQV